MKKILSVILSLVIMISFLPLGVFEIKASATTSGYYTYEISNGEARITSVNTSISGTVTIPLELAGYPVTSIGSSAFEDCDTIENLIISNNIKEIGDSAFFSCSNLKTVQLPSGLTSLGKGAFIFCESLESIAIPDGVQSIENEAFFGCSELVSITIPKSVTYIGETAFSNMEDPFYKDLKDVWYGGTKLDRENIKIAEGNEELLAATWHYKKCEGEHTYTNDCDVECNLCDTIREVEPHKYDNGCDTDCNVCEAVREVKPHNYDNDCDTTCNECQAIREVKPHSYDNDCDAICNICNAVREVEPHKYYAVYLESGTKHWKECSVCGYKNNYNNHKYDNDCDAYCNVCNSKRNVPSHKYTTKTVKATISKSGYKLTECSVCGKDKSKTTIYYPKTVKLSTTSYTYNGKTKKPSVTVKDSKGKTISSKYYTVSYASGRKYVGKYKVTVKFKGNYSGTKTLYFEINPGKTTLKKVTGASKSIKVTITKKTTQVSGYQVQYSTSKKFTSAKTKTITSAKTTSTTIKSLKAKKTYYVRVRTYKTVSGKRYYSGWSTYKSTKTK